MTPNPGSWEAFGRGCLCAVLDNSHGAGHMGGNGKSWDEGGIFVVTVGCPLHAPKTSDAD